MDDIMLDESNGSVFRTALPERLGGEENSLSGVSCCSNTGICVVKLAEDEITKFALDILVPVVGLFESVPEDGIDNGELWTMESKGGCMFPRAIL